MLCSPPNLAVTGQLLQQTHVFSQRALRVQQRDYVTDGDRVSSGFSMLAVRRSVFSFNQSLSERESVSVNTAAWMWPVRVIVNEGCL